MHQIINTYTNQIFLVMKRKNILLGAFLGLISLLSFSVNAQDTLTSPFSVGADVYSNYVWRGTKFGVGPAFQPSVKYTKGVFTAGVWGSFDASGYTEADPYVSISLPFGLSFGVTDYYYGGKLTEISDTLGSHALEANFGFTKGAFTLSANYIFNKAGGVHSVGSDVYLQATYAFKSFSAFVGGGNGWHTHAIDSDWEVCNLGLSTTKTIKLTDSFSIPVVGQIIVNPNSEVLMLVVGFTL